MLAKEIERAGIPTALVTNLTPVAVRVGAPRIVRGARFHHVFGNPGSGSETLEREWRTRALRACLRAVQQPVDGPTVFDFPEFVV